jgi:predicted unusual protein kinase regulating ubiquinone biosynthesis (AarF/ABC1/UbiB family)
MIQTPEDSPTVNQDQEELPTQNQNLSSNNQWAFDPALLESFKRFAVIAGVPLMAGVRIATSAVAGTINNDRNERSSNNQLKNAQMLFDVLGNLRGGAAKIGQALSVFEPAIPQNLIGPYRQSLTKLQEQLPPLPFESLKSSLKNFPEGVIIDPTPVASASLGQVHKAVWLDGSNVAVKIQYPGIEKMVRADAMQLRFLGPVLELLFPGSRAMNVVDEHVKHLQKELDYEAEARNQRRFARFWSSSQDIHIPSVIWVSPTVIVTQWSDDLPLREVISSTEGSQLFDLRTPAGKLLLKFTLTNPNALGLVHGDPHPGNFRISADGKKLTVLDFGAVGDDDRFTELFALAAIAMHDQDPSKLDQAHEKWIRKGWLDEKVTVQDFKQLLATNDDPLAVEEFTFSRDWMNNQASKWWTPSAGMEAITQVKMPPGALLEHRALTGALALCCQLEATIPLKSMLTELLLDPLANNI